MLSKLFWQNYFLDNLVRGKCLSTTLERQMLKALVRLISSNLLSKSSTKFSILWGLTILTKVVPVIHLFCCFEFNLNYKREMIGEGLGNYSYC